VIIDFMIRRYVERDKDTGNIPEISRKAL